jgi:hypothetical protein
VCTTPDKTKADGGSKPMAVDDNVSAGDVSGAVDAKSQPMAVDVPDHVANSDSAPSTAATPQPQPPAPQTVAVAATTGRPVITEAGASDGDTLVSTLGSTVDNDSFPTPAWLQCALFCRPAPSDVVGDTAGNSVDAGNSGSGSASSGKSDVLMDDTTATKNIATLGLPYYASVHLAVTDVGSQYCQQRNRPPMSNVHVNCSGQVMSHCCRGGRGVICCLLVWLTLRWARW